ncbi:MAG: F0F1 ATP synthase subunit A [Spirochaetaceae bacterium]|nr:F0F1 ATP synthase subunit A [Spirochaetaceae bacterium]
MSEAVRETMTVSERITESIAVKTVFTIHAFGLEIAISDTVVMTWIVMAILIALSAAATRRMKMVPGRGQAALEAFVTFVYDFAEENIHHHGRKYAAFLGTVFLFLVTANVIPAFTPDGGFGFEPHFTIKPLTRDINVTAAFAAVTIVTVLVSKIRYKGVGGFFRSFVQPMPFMLPFNIMEYAIRPTSLALRLFGNMLGGYIIMLLVEAVMPLVLPPVVGLYFDFFDGLLQAVVFTYLSTVFIAEAIE